MASKVYYLNDRAQALYDSIPFKGVKVLRDAGLASMIKPGDKVAIKTHLGEWGSALNLRPHWVSAIVDEVKRLGGIPSIVETGTVVYMENGVRASKEMHLKTGVTHGFTEETMGCPIIICDGENGMEDVKVDVPHGVYMKYAFMGKGFLDFDKVIVVSHFKGHAMGVFGGALKNVGIGMASARGKYAIHNMTHPEMGMKTWDINQEVVNMYAQMPSPNLLDETVETCPAGAFEYKDGILTRDKEKCHRCGFCFVRFAQGLFNMPPELVISWPAGITDAATAFINKIGKENMIYLNYAMDITPGCDCMDFHDKTMIPNLGVFASKDPVAVDMACIEAAEAQAVIPGSIAEEYGFSEPNSERFTNCTTEAKLSQWAQMNAAKFNGAGDTEYILVRSKTVPCEEFKYPTLVGSNYMKTYKDRHADVDVDAGDYAYSTLPRLDYGEQCKKPSGKVGEISIDEE